MARALGDEGMSGKVVLLGNSAVGKTTMVLQLLRGEFSPETEPTIGTSCVSKPVETSRGVVVLNIWDTAGQERFRSVVPHYMRGCHAVVLVCAVDSMDSVTALDTWLEDVNGQSYVEDPVVCVFLNKIDLRDECECASDVCTAASQWAKTHNFIFSMLSAKDNAAVHNAFALVGEKLADTVQTTRCIAPHVEVGEEKSNKCSC